MENHVFVAAFSRATTLGNCSPMRNSNRAGAQETANFGTKESVFSK